MADRQKYVQFLNRFPTPGGGGAHRGIFAAGCLGARTGLTEEQVVADIVSHLPPGTRRVGMREITEGVGAAFLAVRTGVSKGGPKPVLIAPGTRERFVAAGRGATAEDLRRRSPVPLDWPDDEGWRALPFLFDESELLFFGDDRTAGKMGESVRTCEEWVAECEADGGSVWPKFIANPLTGNMAPKRSGIGETLRGDGCVAAHRFAVAESDGMSIEDQLAFWAGCPSLPVAMLTFSGSKSIHALVRVDCSDAAEWETKVAGELFPGFLVPLGMDPACKNPARLTRLPGFYRADTNQVQTCLYLAPEGKAVCA